MQETGFGSGEFPRKAVITRVAELEEHVRVLEARLVAVEDQLSRVTRALHQTAHKPPNI